jgi:hypothetical protein
MPSYVRCWTGVPAFPTVVRFHQVNEPSFAVLTPFAQSPGAEREGEQVFVRENINVDFPRAVVILGQEFKIPECFGG